jgi:hypothetical protein
MILEPGSVLSGNHRNQMLPSREFKNTFGKMRAREISKSAIKFEFPIIPTQTNECANSISILQSNLPSDSSVQQSSGHDSSVREPSGSDSSVQPDCRNSAARNSPARNHPPDDETNDPPAIQINRNALLALVL